MLWELLSFWLVHSYYAMTSYYTDLPFMARSSWAYCMDLPFMVDSIDSSAVRGQLQFFRSMQLSWLYKQWCCIWWNSLKSLHKQWPKQYWSFYYCLTWSSSFVYVFKLHWFSPYFQQGRQSRVGQSFAIEKQDFMKASGQLVESIRI